MKLFTALLLLFITNIYSQDYFDKKYYGGNESEDSKMNSVEFTPGGNYLLAGYTNQSDNPGYDGLLIKLNGSGNMIWAKKYGGTGNQDGLKKIRRTSDNYFLLAGYTNSYQSAIQWNSWITKVDSSGIVIWSKEFPGGGYATESYDIIETADSGNLSAGYTKNITGTDGNLYLIKLSKDGLLEWEKVIGTHYSNDWTFSVIQTGDEGYAIAGYSYNNGIDVISLIKLDKDGNLLWSKFFSSGDYSSYAYQIKESSDGSLFIAGSTFISGSEKICLLKTEADGTLLWTKIIGGLFGERAYALEIDSEDNLLIGGYSYQECQGENCDGLVKHACLLKLNSDAEFSWMKLYSETEDSEFREIKTVPNEGYIAAGFLGGSGFGKIYVIKTDTSGSTGCFTSSFQPLITDYSMETISLDVFSPGSNYEDVDVQPSSLQFSETNSCGEIPNAVELEVIPTEFNMNQNFPNPFNPATTIKYSIPNESFVTLIIYDALGNEITKLVNKQQPAGSYNINFDAANLSSGVYYYSIKADGYSETKKMQLIK